MNGNANQLCFLIRVTYFLSN